MRRERSFPGRSAKIYWHSGFFLGASGAQVTSRSRVRPSPRGISSGCQAGLWSNESGSESDGGLAWLNQFRSGSSSGIHSLTACQGGSMGSMVIRVVADGLLAFGREVEEGGGDEVRSLEDLEVALGVVVAFGAVDDGLGGGVPGDLLEGGVFAKATPAQGRDDGGGNWSDKKKSPLLPGIPGRKGGPKIDSVSNLAFLGRRAGSVANWRHDTPGWHQMVPLRPSRPPWRC
jgi:hypothetical protein